MEAFHIDLTMDTTSNATIESSSFHNLKNKWKRSTQNGGNLFIAIYKN